MLHYGINKKQTLPSPPWYAGITVTGIFVLLLGINGIYATEEQCHVDCRAAPPRLVGPTRPSDAFDALGNPLALTRKYPYHVVDSTEESIDFPKYCEWGCTYFFVAPDVHPLLLSGKSTLDLCFDQCDETFRYNITVGYNDLIETARLECRDGCQIGLIRCQPGYYCIQASPAKENDMKSYSGGDMLPCSPGKYRTVDYNQVTRCEPCPQNHFREDIKGKSASDCTKCRAGTSTRKTINTSIKDCVRCPAGFYSEEGSSCKCITPRSCEEQLPFPADAEKRDSVPYIGRW